jgi:hypothetical protein
MEPSQAPRAYGGGIEKETRARMSDGITKRGTFEINVPFVCEGENVVAVVGFDRFDGGPLVVFEVERDTDKGVSTLGTQGRMGDEPGPGGRTRDGSVSLY